MSKNVALIAASGAVVNIKVHEDNYEPQPYEIEVTNAAWIGGDFVGGYFYPPQPFLSWTRSEGEWIAPEPKPDGDYFWNEAAQEWQPADV